MRKLCPPFRRDFFSLNWGKIEGGAFPLKTGIKTFMSFFKIHIKVLIEDKKYSSGYPAPTQLPFHTSMEILCKFNW